MRGLIITFLGVFFFIWAFGTGVSYLQNMYRRNMSVKPNYGNFSPQEIESQRKKMMDDYRRQLKDYQSQQSSSSSQLQSQKQAMETLKRQTEDMKRINKIR
jgi:flagellar motility protein MotE (MotC chaperone)